MSWSCRVLIGAALAVCLGLPLPSLCLSQSKTRDIEVKFTNERPKSNASRKPAYRRQPLYRSSSPRVVVSTGSSLGQIGVTVWRMRPARAADRGVRMLIPGNPVQFVAERSTIDTPIRQQDQMRLSIESARPGYLYVVDRDLFADGTTGEAKLIFPTRQTQGATNEVKPGRLVEIPAQENTFFTANPVRADQSGELLSIIVTAKPMDLPLADEPLSISQAQLASWEKQWGQKSERLEMVGGVGQQQTKEEAEAARPSSGQELAQDGPAPQTIYRLPVGNESGVMISFTLRYEGTGRSSKRNR